MKKTIVLILSIAMLGGSLQGAPKVGELAPEFKGAAASGLEVKLSDFRGQYVVLEWLNHGCPFVKKHYRSGNMQRLQADLVSEGVVWLSIKSSAKGKQGYRTAKETQKQFEAVKSKAHHVIMDGDGTIGHLYDARCTPHMFLISPDGILIYQGAIDDNSSVYSKKDEGVRNFVYDAWNAHRSGKPVNPSSTTPYGCAIKY